MKLRLFVLAVVGFLAVSTTAIASTSCDKAWGYPIGSDKAQKIERAYTGYARIPGTDSLSTEKFAVFFATAVQRKCSKQFGYLPKNLQEDPKQYLEYVLQDKTLGDTISAARVWRLLVNGVDLRLPKMESVEKYTPAVTQAAKDKKKEVIIRKQVLTIQSGLQEGRIGPDMEAGLKKLEAMEAEIEGLKGVSIMLKKAYEELKNVRLTPGMKANLAKFVNKEMEDVLAKLRQDVAKNTRQIGELRTDINKKTDGNRRLIDGLDTRLERVQTTANDSAKLAKDNKGRLDKVEEKTNTLSGSLNTLSSSANISLAAMIAALVIALIAFVLALHNLVRVRSVKQQSEFVKKRIGDLEKEVQDPSRGLAAAHTAIGRREEAEVSAVEKQVKNLESEVQNLSQGLAAAHAAIGRTERRVDVLSTELIPDEGNPSKQELLERGGGRRAALALRYFWKNALCPLEVWRYAGTPEGKVCLNIIKEIGSTEFIDPVDVDDVPDALRRAIADGRYAPAETKNGGVMDVEKSGDEKSQTEEEAHIPAFLRNAG